MTRRYLYRVEVQTANGWCLVRHYQTRAAAKYRATFYGDLPVRILRSDPITWPEAVSAG